MSTNSESHPARGRLPVLLAIVAILVAWAWIFERGGPAFPHGNFYEVIAVPVLLLFVAYVVSLFGDFQNGSK